MPKTTHTLLPVGVAQTPITIASNAQEVAVSVGARSVSWYHSGRASTVEAFALDVARAVAASVVDDLITYLSSDLPPVATPEVAESEWLRLQERMHEFAADYAHATDAVGATVAAGDAFALTDETKRALACEALLHRVALDVSAALLRARAVRW